MTRVAQKNQYSVYEKKLKDKIIKVPMSITIHPFQTEDIMVAVRQQIIGQYCE